MKLTKYEISLLQKDFYWFVSSGKQGDIYKGVLFQPLPDHNRFNLAMGDIHLQTGQMQFDELSGNGDARKVFATIGDIVKEYTEIYPDREILVSGNTNDKKRSYSFMTARYLEEILMDFDVWGAHVGGELEPFEKDKIYDAILVKRK
ncbi:MAG: hypothetical protein JWQ09_5913 [Segetibacter sp.]|nr:hypothetical protein [Segetibacter sp.]